MARPVCGPMSASMKATPCSSASWATSLSTWKPTRLPAKAGVSLVSTTSRPQRSTRKRRAAATTSGSVPEWAMSSQPTMTLGGL